LTIFSSGIAWSLSVRVAAKGHSQFHVDIIECAEAGTFAYRRVGVYRNRDLIFEVDVVVCVAMLH
jgi:hypothetical protein